MVLTTRQRSNVSETNQWISSVACRHVRLYNNYGRKSTPQRLDYTRHYPPFYRQSILGRLNALSSGTEATAEGEIEEGVSTTKGASWSAFSEAASGEWDGVTASFDVDGKPKQLPEYYVPEAFREWGVELYDWQTQCSMLVQDEGMKYNIRRLMPTVGCEADAIAFTEECQESFASDNMIFNVDGSYSKAPVGLDDANEYKSAAEHCITLPDPSGVRVRAIQNFKRTGQEKVWSLMDIELHFEKRDGPYTGRRELAGCGGGMPAFGTTPAVDSVQLQAALMDCWKADGIRISSKNDIRSVSKDSWSMPEWLSMDDVIGLPKNSWMGAIVSGSCARLIFGSFLSDKQDSMKLSIQSIENGKLASAELLLLEKE